MVEWKYSRYHAISTLKQVHRQPNVWCLEALDDRSVAFKISLQDFGFNFFQAQTFGLWNIDNYKKE